MPGENCPVLLDKPASDQLAKQRFAARNGTFRRERAGGAAVPRQVRYENTKPCSAKPLVIYDMIFLFAASPCNSRTNPLAAPPAGSTTSVTIRQPPASIKNVCGCRGLVNTSPNPAAHNAIPAIARTPLRVFIARRGPLRPPPLARDKLPIRTAIILIRFAPAWRCFATCDSDSGGSDCAVWRRETQRPPHRLHEWVLRFAPPGPCSQLGASPRAGRRLDCRLEQR